MPLYPTLKEDSLFMGTKPTKWQEFNFLYVNFFHYGISLTLKKTQLKSICHISLGH